MTMTLQDSVDRLQQNEARLDQFVNDPAAVGSYTTRDGQAVPTVPALVEQVQLAASALGNPDGAANVGYTPATGPATTVQATLRELQAAPPPAEAAAAAVTAHEEEANPHPQYLTEQEADDAYLLPAATEAEMKAGTEDELRALSPALIAAAVRANAPKSAHIGDILTTARIPDASHLPATGGIYLQSSYPELFDAVGLIGGEIGLTWTASGATGIDTSRALTALATDGAGVWITSTGDISGTHRPRRSSDNGLTWADVSGPSDMPASDIATDSKGLWMGVRYENLIYRSSDNGLTWTAVSIGSGTSYINSIATDGAGVWIACGYDGKVLRSTNNGVTWVVSTPAGASPTLNSIATDGAGVWVIVGYNTILRSTDNGSSWVSATVSGDWKSVSSGIAGVWVFVGSAGVAMRSVDNGLSWTPVQPGVGAAQCRAVASHKGGTWLITTADGKVSRSTDNGASWAVVVTSPGTVSDVYAVAISPAGTALVAGVGAKVARSNSQFGYDTATQFRVPRLSTPGIVLSNYIKAL